MPQFAFDGIFAPLSTAPATSRSTGAPLGTGMFDQHLAQARRLPDPLPVAPTAPEKPQPSSPVSTQPVSPADRRPKPTETSSDPQPYKTNGAQPTATENSAENKPSNVAQGNSTTANGEGAATDSSPRDKDSPATLPEKVDSTNEHDDGDADEQHDAIAAALANLDTCIKSATAPTEESQSEDQLQRGAEQASETLDLHAEVSGKSTRKSLAEKVQKIGATDEAKSSPKAISASEAEPAVTAPIDEVAVGAEDTAEETSSRTSKVVEAESSRHAEPTDGEQAQVQISRNMHARNVSRSGADVQDESATSEDEPTRSPLDTESSKPATGARRREPTADRSAESVGKNKTDVTTDPMGAASAAVPIETENSTGQGTTVAKGVSDQDRVPAIEANHEGAPQDSPEQHASPAKSRHEAEAARDATVERTGRPHAGPSREADAAPRSQLLTDVERLRLVHRVAKAIQTSATSADGGQMRLRLTPPELGSLRMEIVVRQGTVTAHVEAETAAAREVLLDNLPALRDRLAEQNIKLERFDVDLMRQSLDQTPQHTGNPEREHARDERRGHQAVSAETQGASERAPVSTAVIQDGHVNIVI
ncbi:MAG: flagellar hook-length control protein FliK [Pirellulales bacterium]|nr:flagellar hook-length control protein FliK [Pirellulales bacterium]